MTRTSKKTAQTGDILTLEFYDFQPENDYVPVPLFDLQGCNVSFVLGWGNFLPGLHEILMGRTIGETISNVSIDAGWGSRRQDLLILNVPIKKLRRLGVDESRICPGETVTLKKGIEVVISSVNDQEGTVVLDANHPLAGSSYNLSCRIKDIVSFSPDTRTQTDDHRFKIATFALGCFWGAELAFMRVPGVVGTRVGYSQGRPSSINPTYEQVCEGSTHHREVVQVIYDSDVVQYHNLVDVAMNRLYETVSPLNHNLFESEIGEKQSKQYRYGFISHSDEQQAFAKKVIDQHEYLGIDLLSSQKFWMAEDYHQQYLYKGGQSARKGSKDKIRCFG